MNEITELLGLGKMLCEPERICGGLLHRVDRIHCESGIYALKTLNPQIMKRPDALGNMVRSEHIARALKDIVPVVHAIEREGKCVFFLKENYYILYPWMEGKSIFSPYITKAHCAAIGDILGKIHQADVQVDDHKKENVDEAHFDWACLPKEDWLAVLVANQAKIEKLQWEVNKSIKLLSSQRVISHRDMDPKNVLWQKDKPLLIDWEAAGYINPYQELMETAYYWADNGAGELQEELFKAFMCGYVKHVSVRGVDWQAVFAACYAGQLGWLYYNIRRATGLETLDMAERELGRKQVLITLDAIKAQDEKNKKAFQWIQNYL